MAKYGCTVARSDFYPVLLPLPASNASERHRLRSEVETIQRDDRLADNHPRRRSVVSDGIRKFDLPLCDPDHPTRANGFANFRCCLYHKSLSFYQPSLLMDQAFIGSCASICLYLPEKKSSGRCSQ